MVNSSWTRGHIDALWRKQGSTKIVFPPCDTAAFCALPLQRQPPSCGGRVVVSVAQFRPEKDHALQIKAFGKLLGECPGLRRGPDRVRLVLIGGCRNEGDRGRVAALQQLAADMGLRRGPEASPLEDGDWDIAFKLNIEFSELLILLGCAIAGLHTMRDEHFGIGVVEFLAAGAIAIAHDSAGPKLDIVVPTSQGRPTGFLASCEDTYAAALRTVLEMPEAQRSRIATDARESVAERFSEAAFGKGFLDSVAPLLLNATR